MDSMRKVYHLIDQRGRFNFEHSSQNYAISQLIIGRKLGIQIPIYYFRVPRHNFVSYLHCNDGCDRVQVCYQNTNLCYGDCQKQSPSWLAVFGRTREEVEKRNEVVT